jgi:hypothetical protein
LQHEFATQCHLAGWVGGYSSLRSSTPARGAHIGALQCVSGTDNSLVGAASHEAPSLACLQEHPSWRLAGSVVHAWSLTAHWWLVSCAKLAGWPSQPQPRSFASKSSTTGSERMDLKDSVGSDVRPSARSGYIIIVC